MIELRQVTKIVESLAKNIAEKIIQILVYWNCCPDETEKKQIVFVGIFYKNNLYIKKYNLTPDRTTNRELTVILCLNEVRKILINSK